MKKDEKPYIKVEIGDIYKYMFNVKIEVNGTNKDIKYMTVSLLSSIREKDIKLLVEILKKFMEGM